jgi:hypothetical protein
LVKDALIALTRSSAGNEHDPRVEDRAFNLHAYNTAPSTAAHTTSSISTTTPHPPPRRVFEYWHLFVSRVDPMIKLIHCPTFAKKLFSLVDNININNIPAATNALLFAIYYAAVSSCTAAETRRRFGEAQEVLLRRYGISVEVALGEMFETPGLEGLQGLVLYMVSEWPRTLLSTEPVRLTTQHRSVSAINPHPPTSQRYSPSQSASHNHYPSTSIRTKTTHPSIPNFASAFGTTSAVSNPELQKKPAPEAAHPSSKHTIFRYH